MATAIAKPEKDEKRNKDRSPAFPFIGLRAAIERAKEFYKEDKRNAAPVSVAVEHWGYGQKSSTGMQTVAALKYFNLLKDSGTGDQRKLQLTDLGLRIVMDERAVSPERDALIKKAALMPKVYAHLWNEWGTTMPSEENIRHHLRVDLKFSDSTVDSLVRGYKDTIAFAKLSESDKIGVEDGDAGSGDRIPEVGDYVQWESQGVIQFREPKRVTGFSGDGNYVFVDGSSTGLPIGEVTKAKAPTVEVIVGDVSKSRLFSASTNKMQEDVFSLSEGRVVIQWPSPLSAESIEDLKEWLKIVERKITRPVRTKAWEMKPTGNLITCTSCGWSAPMKGEDIGSRDDEFQAHICAGHRAKEKAPTK